MYVLNSERKLRRVKEKEAKRAQAPSSNSFPRFKPTPFFYFCSAVRALTSARKSKLNTYISIYFATHQAKQGPQWNSWGVPSPGKGGVIHILLTLETKALQAGSWENYGFPDTCIKDRRVIPRDSGDWISESKHLATVHEALTVPTLQSNIDDQGGT